MEAYVESYFKIAKRLSQITSRQQEKELEIQKTKDFKQMNFVEIEGLSYNMYKAFEQVSLVVMLSMNIALSYPDFKAAAFEKALPPQHTFEVMTDILSNEYLHKDCKVQVIEIMTRLI